MRISNLFAAILAATAAMPAAAQTFAAPAPAADDAAPLRPAGVAASFATPPRDAAGAYLTPNRDLAGDETTWHVRVALNVAALGCRDADEAQTVARYNAVLAGARAPLAAAQAGMMRRYAEKFGAAAQARNDDTMTKLYNFFAQPTGHAGFCVAAKQVLADSAAVEPADFPAFAAAALVKLEAPFLAFFADYDAYRSAAAAWTARHAAPVMIATVAAPPVAIAATAAAAPVTIVGPR